MQTIHWANHGIQRRKPCCRFKFVLPAHSSKQETAVQNGHRCGVSIMTSPSLDPETDPHQFVRLVCSHFKAKEVFHLVKQKHVSPLGTFCKVLDKRLTGDQKPIEGEVVEDDMVIVTATVQIVADHSAQTHTSPDATVSAHVTLDQGASKQNCRSEHVLVYADCA